MILSWLTLTDPKDVARIESRTIISTEKLIETIPIPKSGFKEINNINLKNVKSSQLGNWMSQNDLQDEMDSRLPGCMRGRTMYVIPYSMGPVGGPLSKIGIEITGK